MKKNLSNRNRISRRAWLGSASLSASALAALSPRKVQGIDYTKPVPEAEGLTAYANHGNVHVRWNNLPLCNYRAQEGLKYPYFHPVNGPVSGLSLTAESALPYPHHRGIWLGCHPLNDGDYWSDKPLDTGQIQSKGLEIVDVPRQETGKTNSLPKTSASFSDQCEWVWEGHQSPLKDQRQFSIKVFPDRPLWILDMDLTLEALETIEIEKAKHSLLAIRAASDISCPEGGILMNSEGGTGAEGTYGKEARWCGYHGKRKMNPEVVEGITMMTHPDNPWRPVWFTREYGHLSPSPFQFLEKPWILEKGESIRLRYRFALHGGSPAEVGMDEVYTDWVKER